MTVNFEARDMQPEDAHAIMQRMWQPGAAELDRIGMDGDPEAIAEKFIKMNHYGWTFFANGEMVAICGAEEVEGTCYTWFMATPALQSIGRDFTIWLRKFCKEAVEREGVKLEMYSASLHPNSDRWFAALGFARGQNDIGIFRHYLYARKKELTVKA